MEEIPQGERVKPCQLGDSFCIEYSLQMLRWNSFDEHENFDLGEFDARDSFPRCPMVNRHAQPPQSSDRSEAFD